MNTLQPDNHEISRPVKGPVSGVPGMSLELAMKGVEAAYLPDPEVVTTSSSADTRVSLTPAGEVVDGEKRARIAAAQREVDAAYLEGPQTTAAQSMNLLME